MRLLLDLMAPEVRANPYPYYAELRRMPVCQVAPGGMWAISRHEDVMEVLRDPRRFSSAGLGMSFRPPWLERNPTADSLVMKDPPVHTRLRALVSRAFTAPALALLESRIRAIAEELATRVVQRGHGDFVSDFGLPLPARVLGLLISMDEALYPRLKMWADDLLSIPGGQPSPERRQEIWGSLAAMEACFETLLAARRDAPGEGLLGDLRRAELSGRLDHQEVISFLFGLVPAGLETTVHLLGNTMIVLSQHPHALQRVLADMSLIPKLVNEVLRFEPPGHTSLRLVTEDTEIGGAKIPRGSVVVLLLASALRDERCFPDADTFLLDREKPSQLPFGHGVHYCLGAALARMEARLGLEALLARTRSVRVAFDRVQWSRSLIARGPVALPLLLSSAPA